MKVTVYNKKTGKPVEVEGVDAVEYVKTGGWTKDPEEVSKTNPKPKTKAEK